jgi:hypothetical protein
MNPRSDADTLRRSAVDALSECLELLQHSENPDWDTIHRLLSQAQKQAGIAEYLAADEVSAPSEPEPIVPSEPEPVVNAESELEPELEPEPERVTVKEDIVQEAQVAPSAGISLAEKLSEQPLENLKTHLSINNRVRFATLLTDGNVPGLLELCDELQACPSFDEAQRLLLSTSGDIDWEDEDSGGPEFLGMVRRLFSNK